ncbi:GIY-YIG nuclease family protein [Rhodococcus aetherivorans]|uniref:GIY-YIG nuclease family protein n=1 Tax=Rhodococcus aetherivorans TaxID=191292 RepID=UPI0031D4FDBF
MSYESAGHNLYLCQEHLLLAWSIVQEQIKRAEGGPFKVVGEKKKPTPMTAEEIEQNYGCVYYLQVGDRIKIGFSTRPEKRLAQYPPGSRLIAIRRGTRKTERAEHIRYDKYLADGREWFHYSEEMEQDICIEDHRAPNDVDGYEGDPDTQDWKRKKADPRTRVEYRNRDMVG